MSKSQAELLGRLQPGQAFIYSDQMFRPELTQIPFKEEKSIIAKREISSNELLNDANLLNELRVKVWFKSSLRQRSIELSNDRQILEHDIQHIQEFARFIEDNGSDMSMEDKELRERELVSRASPLLHRIQAILVEYRSLESHHILDSTAKLAVQGLSIWRDILADFVKSREQELK